MKFFLFFIPWSIYRDNLRNRGVNAWLPFCPVNHMASNWSHDDTKCWRNVVKLIFPCVHYATFFRHSSNINNSPILFTTFLQHFSNIFYPVYTGHISPTFFRHRLVTTNVGRMLEKCWKNVSSVHRALCTRGRHEVLVTVDHRIGCRLGGYFRFNVEW